MAFILPWLQVLYNCNIQLQYKGQAASHFRLEDLAFLAAAGLGAGTEADPDASSFDDEMVRCASR